MTNEPQNTDGPEAGATPEAEALHGAQARAEQYPQPEAVALDGDTRIAVDEPDDE